MILMTDDNVEDDKNGDNDGDNCWMVLVMVYDDD